MKHLKDSSKFKSIPVASDKDLDYVINSEKRVTDVLEELKNKNAISEETYNKLRPVGSKLGKPLKNGLLPFRPIISAISIPLYWQNF